MMNQTEQIIENYKNGDFEKRLNLFLECPSLRDTFQKIDQDEIDDTVFAKKKLGKKRLRRLRRRINKILGLNNSCDLLCEDPF